MTDAMRNVPENELFSAYVDGELTAAEQAEVEQLLATSPAARQLVDDLRSLSATLQGLPVQQLGVDLSQEVLRLAEHRMLSGRGDSDTELEKPFPQSGSWRAFVRRWTRPRIWVWPGVAVAVSLLLMVLQPQPGRRWDRVLGEKGEKVVALAPPSRQPAEPPAIGPLVEADTNRRAEKPGIAPAAAPTAENQPGPAAQSRSAEVAAKVPVMKSAGPAPAPKAESSAVADAAKDSASPPIAAMRPKKDGGQAEQARLAQAGPSKEKASDEVTIVFCDVAPQAIPFVEQVLAKREIPVWTAEGLRRERKQVAKGQPGPTETANRAEGETKAVPASPGDKSSASESARDAQAVVCLRAEATSNQLEAVLADLRAKPDLVRSLAQSHVTGPGADDAWESLLQAGAVPSLKQKGPTLSADMQRIAAARRAQGGAMAGASKRFQAAVQDAPTEAQTAGGAGGPVQAPSGGTPPAGQQAQNMAASASQRALKTEPALGTRGPFRTAPPEAAMAPQAPRQAVEARADREIESAGAGEVKRRVVFVLRPAGESPDVPGRANHPPADHAAPPAANRP